MGYGAWPLSYAERPDEATALAVAQHTARQQRAGLCRLVVQLHHRDQRNRIEDQVRDIHGSAYPIETPEQKKCEEEQTANLDQYEVEVADFTDLFHFPSLV